MLSDEFTIAIVPFSLGISGLIFFFVALYLKYRYSYKGGIKTTGTLVGFRKLDNDHYIGAMNSALGMGKYEDLSYNKQNSKPIIRFTVNERVIETHSEWSVVDLQSKDIGKTVQIRYFPVRGGRCYRVNLEGDHYEFQRIRARKVIFWIFASIGIILIVIAVLLRLTLFY